MDRRTFLQVAALTPAAVTGAMSLDGAAHAATQAAHTFGFTADGSGFLLDGQRFQIRSGEMHPARIPVEYWQHRIQMAKAMGMNTIAIYVMWNDIETREGVFDFSTGRRNIEAFIALCQAEGMWVLLRPGPYVCGEWDLGGIPSYLLRHGDIALRVNSGADAHYMAAVTRYYQQLIPRMKPLMAANGGPILMVQIENEFGSYANDQTYLQELKALWVEGGIDGPFYTEDLLSAAQANNSVIPGAAIALSAGTPAAIEQCRAAYPNVPAMGGEVYPGWLTHWGDGTFQGQDSDISGALQGFMDKGYSFNIYVIHGGTNFGFFAGANARDDTGGYAADITSYDYSAPITEQGARGPRYDTYRDIIAGHVGTLPDVPEPIATIAPPSITPVRYASIWDNIPDPVSADQSTTPQPMEAYGQSFGFMLYRKDVEPFPSGSLDIDWVHDYATVFVDGRYQGGLTRQWVADSVAWAYNLTRNDDPLTLSAAASASARLDILVEGMGRTNYGHGLIDRKGIIQQVTLGSAGVLTGWSTHLLPMDEAYVANLSTTISDPTRPGQFFAATLDLSEPGDTYLDMRAWSKGIVWVNGICLGRYWEIGPQHRLYCPGAWLRAGANEILVFDHHRVTAQQISFATALA